MEIKFMGTRAGKLMWILIKYSIDFSMNNELRIVQLYLYFDISWTVPKLPEIDSWICIAKQFIHFFDSTRIVVSSERKFLTNFLKSISPDLAKEKRDYISK